jgi:hypothetical protein
MADRIGEWLALILAAGAVLALVWRGVLRPLREIAAAVGDLVEIRAALTPDHGTSVADIIDASSVGIARIEAGLADHCHHADMRMRDLATEVARVNTRTDRALELLAGAPVRVSDRADRTRSTDA